jgi:hypothetical protein
VDCDDQLRIVKRNDNPDALPADMANVRPLSVATELDALRRGDEPFRIRDRRPDLPRPILGMSREAHPSLSRAQTNLSPLNYYAPVHGSR